MKTAIAKKTFHFHAVAWTALACVGWGTSPAANAQLNLLREPSNARVTEPAPNIMLSLDDSGSMGWDLNGCSTPDWRVDVYGDFNEAGAVNCPGRAWNTRPSRMTILRAALLDTFGNPATGSKGIIEDNRIRLAWQSMWDNARTSRPGHLQNWQDSIVAGQPNAIRPFSGAHRQNFYDFVRTLSPVYGTPSHKMMSNVRNYMYSGLSLNSPFASNPGVTAEPYLACRRSYHIFMTDGSWNSETGGIGNYDGSNFNLPDGTAFGASDQTRIYRDPWGGSIGTLADWAMANWATDFQTSVSNQVKPIIKVPGNETVGSTTLSPYWNPKNNPMTWQGVNQYTIGFGRLATQWTGNPVWGSSGTADTHSAQDYARLINGNVGWSDVFSGGEPARPLDLWHMAINGRGKYYQAANFTDLRVAFSDILQTILVDTSSSLAAGAGSNLKVGLSGQAFLSAYDGANWRGELKALRISAQGTIDGTQWDADKLLDSRNLGSAPRLILTHNGSSATTFDWSKLSQTQQSALRGADNDTIAQQRMAYLRGDRTLEQPNGSMRQRDSRLGSLVNSVPVFMGPPTVSAVNFAGRRNFVNSNRNRKPVLFVGSNGGMLHAFDAGNTSTAGSELFAYVPRGVYSKLRDYTLPTYQHQFMVDGTPMVGDVELANGWRSVLVGSLGLGGRGYFVMDVTDTNTFTAAAAPSMVLVDRTEPGSTGAENHIGYLATPPVVDDIDDNRSAQIAKLNNNRWAVVLGNGVNSASGQAVLLIQYLDQDRELIAIPTSSENGNGLGTPRLVDLDGNGTADLVYAGDIRGNLWGFNLTDNNEGNWSARFSGQPLFVARNTSNALQSITAAPYVMRVPRTQSIQIAFGTGRLMDTGDAANTAIQTLYSIRDDLTYTRNTSGLITVIDGSRITGGRTSLVTQTSSNFSSNFASTSTNAVNYTNRRGWFLDLQQNGERQIASTDIFQDSVVRFRTTIPSTQQGGESCNLSTSRGRFFSTYLDIFNGTPPKTSIFGFNSGNHFGLPGTSISRVEHGGPVQLGMATTEGEKIISCSDIHCGTKDDPSSPSTPDTSLDVKKTSPQGALVDWRRLQ